MSLRSRIMGVRAGATPTAQAVADQPQKAPASATQNVWWGTPGMPMTAMWDADAAVQVGYYGYIYHYRCARKIAMAIAGLPFRAGKNPDSPGAFSALAPLALKLGPAPGGPTPNISSKQLWTWSIVSYLITGRWAWETPTMPRSNMPTGLWPLVASRLFPVVSTKPGEWFSGYQYQTNNGRTDMGADDVFYAWRPSQIDWRQPESAMQAMALPSQIAVELDRFMRNFMRNSMVTPKMVITPGFDDDAMRRSFQDQFLSEMTGSENAGRVAFGEWEDDGTVGGAKTPGIQVVDLGTKPVDAQLIELQNWVRDVICDGWGVPVSMLGQAAERTYENADQEHRNFWTGPILETISELQDLVNIGLAPRFGDDVGWFDLSKVQALKPAHRFTQISAKDAKDSGIATLGEIREDVDLPPEIPTDLASETDPLPATEDTPGSTSGGSSSGGAGRRADQFGGFRSLAGELEAFHGQVRAEVAEAVVKEPEPVGEHVDGREVLAYLSDNYPAQVLGWVNGADWVHRKVSLAEVKLGRRPGGRDMAKVEAIAQAIEDGKKLDPVVLVDTGEDKLEVADGYHRLLAYQRAGVDEVDAYVGSGASQHGPWETEMHDAKLNRDELEESPELWAAVSELLDDGVREFDPKEPRDPDGQWTRLAGVIQATAREAEKVATPIIDQLAAEHQGAVVGKQHRIKTIDSLVKKIGDHVDRGLTLEQTQRQISDANRYTVVFPHDQYVERSKAAIATLRQHGRVRVENYWHHERPYRGTNSTVVTTEGGHRFEVQFHTPASYAMTKRTHALYKASMAAGSISDRRRAERELHAMWQQVAIPSGVDDVRRLATQQR